MDLSQWEASDLIAFVSIIILGTSFIAPAFVAFVQRQTELRSKKLDIFKDNYSKRYNRQYYIFQDFIEKSGNIIAQLDSKVVPSDKNIQEFESAALKCLIFLDPKERKEFDVFRIDVKKELGIEDPREKPSTIHTLINPKPFLGINSILFKQQIVNQLYTSFNKCIKIASAKLATIEEEEQEQLYLVSASIPQRLGRTLISAKRKLSTQLKLKAKAIRKQLRRKT
ncbi:TPA: hypothetical protein VJE68_000053 [Streptococcus pyogenes]|uniref:hypothetical protein n=1 Tax=Streptococcus halichoeri TaxID=254785 RepID=UPI001358EDD5|nr:hypothetical protein [Streptococcus halichoeri]HEP1510588.1 hypothetical protein [Streptococcus pyogenes]HER0886566.1 hypothetical protein [Streptococcus pyogenes]HER0889982.1 hypothetical protein [Streptococcus pyogenes]HER0893349.1 hypothetical protein [Streptococcus pyogenes]